MPGGRYPERWLVVSERRGLQPLGPHDAKLLDALVAVGSSALDNAGLVEQLKHEAFHDALTGLPNQLLFEETVGLALAERRQPERKLGVFVLDLDRFKRVNDSLGHPAGNELLREVARRLTGAVRTGDTVARMSGDEFTVLVTGLRSTGEAALVEAGSNRSLLVATSTEQSSSSVTNTTTSSASSRRKSWFSAGLSWIAL